MSEDVYAEPDLTKKVRFQKNDEGYKEESEKNVKDDVDGEMIYDNSWAEENSPPKVEDDTTENQQQINSIDANSDERNYLQTALLLMGLLCFLLLVTIIVVLSIIIVEWKEERNLRTELQERNGDLEKFNDNLTRWNRLLEDEKTNLTVDRDQLQAMNTNLTKETEELNQKLHEIFRCPNGEWRFNNSWYFISKSRKDWSDSKAACEELDATLTIISTEEEQRFISSLNRPQMWIGLRKEENGNDWKWINGDEVTTTYWQVGQPDDCSACGGEDCAEIYGQSDSLNNWNDLTCREKIYFICEKRP